MAPLLALLVVDLRGGVERHRRVYDVQSAPAAAQRTARRRAEADLRGCHLPARSLPDTHRRSTIPGDRGSIPLVRADVGWTAMGAQSALPRTGCLPGLHRDP